ncbi:hypothetical protein QRX50_36040 [Amycolatopsis carbonis]|uniref:Uncharacterized protein n=1 Tax=Amycolatopsis carbonis TaxID=715471 RepID=A0A9Y2IB31_9PSEU|nr:hypothetical protein [Amycolatopsis sp. 2-15]WIX76807.1 hypothetical protein QRX50_36040 [Amycolatopsis sp. 2-15]
MTAVAHARPTISPFAIANGMPHIGGHPAGLLADRTGATHGKTSRRHTFLVDGGPPQVRCHGELRTGHPQDKLPGRHREPNGRPGC